MELQWPLIIFTACMAWSAGLLASQSIAAFAGRGSKAQVPALATSFAILVVGGVAVFFHLHHWERIFNGFGHITSGITQELIAIVLMVLVMLVFFIQVRRSGAVSRAVAVAGVVVSVVLCIAVAHSYMLASRPVWDSVLWPLCMLGNACVLGPATYAFILGACARDGEGEEDAESPKPRLGMTMLVGAGINAVCTLAYLVSMACSSGRFFDVGYSFDPVLPNKALPDVSSLVAVFTGSEAVITWVGVILVGLLAPLACAALARAGKVSYRVAGAAAVLAAFVGALCLRVVFYDLGTTMFLLF